ncbi:protein LSM14 homolog A-like [Macrosteles quadrilineatus]|uniref:protein LSM14 homolog A-like n=1 Tax=Macrosteles quadrilineatus TaxID=74068 RepID=UPI0023E0E1E7|nr:protein LSM14 homolog A-like [Macrosteles quadrilineatus]XP_054287707.1 protein LSM14 homolog A-like [Macrosteles quadrilineatus]
MSSSMPEIGSKISLISKADIRYEGKLFTVDPNECTIALSHVRSFGTEDRQAQYPVPAQSQVYEYILFRGTDIKDISIINTQQLPDDPAIVMGMGPGGMSTGSGNYPGQPGFNHTMPSMPPQYSGYRAPGVGRTVGHQPLSSELPDSHLQHPPPHQPPPTHQPPPQVQVQVPVIPIVKEPNSELLSGSRSSTPSLSRKSPTNDQGVQVSPNKDKKPIQPPIPRDGRQNRNDRYQDSYQRRDYRGPRDNDYRDRNQRDGEYRDRNQRDGDFRDRGQNNALKEDHRMQRQGSHDRRDPDNRRESFPGQQQGGRGQQNRGGWVNRGGRGGGPGMRGRGRGGAPGNFNRAPGSGQAQQNKNNTGKQNTLKFEEEYDFDKANSEFEELKNKTAKLKISDGEVEKPKVNGEDKKDDSGNETGLGEGEPEEEPEQEVIYYDKAKSFFDNISCEAVERSKGRSQRTDWRTERKLNSETFGVALARRGGYRGRGGYYGGRGGYRVYNNRGYNNQRGGRNPMNNTGQPRPLHQPPQAK